MPVELRDLLGDKRWIEVQLPKGSFRVAYNPGAISLRRQAEIEKSMREMRTTGTQDELELVNNVGRVLCDMVVDWDLSQDGRPLPITVDVACSFPFFMFTAIMQAITEDGLGNNSEEKKVLVPTSGTILRPTASWEPTPNGTPSSEQRGTWA
jgi:hypothetical protein